MTADHSDPNQDMLSPDGEIDPIEPAAAELILADAVQPYVDDGWFVLDRSSYTARLTKGLRNLDIQVNLLGEVEKNESGLTPLQETGRLVAWMLLLASLLVTLVVASLLGII